MAKECQKILGNVLPLVIMWKLLLRKQYMYPPPSYFTNTTLQYRHIQCARSILCYVFLFSTLLLRCWQRFFLDIGKPNSIPWWNPHYPMAFQSATWFSDASQKFDDMRVRIECLHQFEFREKVFPVWRWSVTCSKRGRVNT